MRLSTVTLCLLPLVLGGCAGHHQHHRQMMGGAMGSGMGGAAAGHSGHAGHAAATAPATAPRKAIGIVDGRISGSVDSGKKRAVPEEWGSIMDDRLPFKGCTTLRTRETHPHEDRSFPPQIAPRDRVLAKIRSTSFEKRVCVFPHFVAFLSHTGGKTGWRGRQDHERAHHVPAGPPDGPDRWRRGQLDRGRRYRLRRLEAGTAPVLIPRSSARPFAGRSHKATIGAPRHARPAGRHARHSSGRAGPHRPVRGRTGNRRPGRARRCSRAPARCRAPDRTAVCRRRCRSAIGRRGGWGAGGWWSWA